MEKERWYVDSMEEVYGASIWSGESFPSDLVAAVTDVDQARLIAAAPEMREVLEALDRSGDATADTVLKARRLLARIRGE